MSIIVTEPQELDVDGLPVEEIVARLLERAFYMHASDLFLESNEGDMTVLMRHLGLIQVIGRLPLAIGHRCVSHIKALAGMSVAEHRHPLDGRYIFEQDGQRMDLRVSTLPTLYGEDCCIRLLVKEFQSLSLEQLGLLPKDLNDLLAMLNSPSGLMLVTGPTGSGKTTSVYACLRYLNNGQRKINTIEDPIEYGLDGVRQSEVNARIGADFPDLLRGVLRQAPDVIVIGEIRDALTAATAVHAANSGHLVLATVHAPLASSALESMRAWGVPSHFLASSLIGIVAQRLVRTLCPDCRSPYPLFLAPHVFDEVRRWLEPDQGLALYYARGCPACHGSGYAGRTGVFEVLRTDHTLRSLIADAKPVATIRQHAIDNGLIELRQAALLKVALGETTAEEIIRVIPSEDLGLDEDEPPRKSLASSLSNLKLEVQS